MRKSVEAPLHTKNFLSTMPSVVNFIGLLTTSITQMEFTSSNLKNGQDQMHMTRTSVMPVHQAWVTGLRKPVRVFNVQSLLIPGTEFSFSKLWLYSQLSTMFVCMYIPSLVGLPFLPTAPTPLICSTPCTLYLHTTLSLSQPLIFSSIPAFTFVFPHSPR